MFHFAGCQSHTVHWGVFFNKFAIFHDLISHMRIQRHQYLFQMLSRCIYDIWERFCVAKINIVHFTSKNSSTRFSFFCYSLLYTILAGDKSRAGFVRRTFNPKSTGVLSMQKCIEWVVPRRGNETEQYQPRNTAYYPSSAAITFCNLLFTFPYNYIEVVVLLLLSHKISLNIFYPFTHTLPKCHTNKTFKKLSYLFLLDTKLGEPGGL